MEDQRQPEPQDPGTGERPSNYVPPTVEDLDTGHGPAVTAAGGTASSISAPRSL